MTTTLRDLRLSNDLTVGEMTQLRFLKATIVAREWLGQTQEFVSMDEARHLAFSAYLRASLRISEFSGASYEWDSWEEPA